MTAIKPKVIVCPHCNALRVNRTNGRCGACGVRLVYLGEIVDLTSPEYQAAWYYTGMGWITYGRLCDWIRATPELCGLEIKN
jgi:hypothetical protein